MELRGGDQKFTQRFDKPSHKIDDIYERSAVTTIIERLRADHQLEIRYLPTNRTFSASASSASKDFFDQFEIYLKKNYQHLWNKKFKSILVSICLRQIKFDVLGFAHESTCAT